MNHDPYVRSLAWRYPQQIEPLPMPYPWRRIGFALAFTALCVGGGALVVLL